MALGTSSFGTILQASSENFFVNNTNNENTQAVVAAIQTNNQVETAGSIACAQGQDLFTAQVVPSTSGVSSTSTSSDSSSGGSFNTIA